MKTINGLMKTHTPSEYNGFSIGDFLKGKQLKIESVRQDKINGRRCIKTDVRIARDESDENIGKVFTVRLDETTTFEEGMFEGYLKETKNYLGYPLLIDSDTDIEQAYFFQQNMLTLVVNDYSVDTEAEKQEIELTSMKDRPLKNIGEYRVFDIEGFINNNNLHFIGTYYEKGNIVFNTLLNEQEMIKLSVSVEKYDSLPASLLTLNKTFEECVSDYTFSRTTIHRYGTRWTLHFDDITFKSGVITDGMYKLSYDEPEFHIESTMNKTAESNVESKNDANESVSRDKEHLGKPRPSMQSQRKSAHRPFGQRRRI